MTLYEEYKRLKINFAAIGLEKGSTQSDYFCTPRGVKIIGWAGVDGIHYCFIKAFDQMVFAVSPMNTPGDYVHPLARNFEDFLRLLLACADPTAIEQAHAWNQEQFDVFLKENSLTDEQSAMLNILKEKFFLAPMEQPFAYIKELQASFDYSKLKYIPDYYEWVSEEQKEQEPPEWKVYYSGNFWGHHGREHAGKEISVAKQFSWGDEVWHIPAIYACSTGLVVDFCVEVKPERIKAYHNKWNLSDDDNFCFGNEEREQAIAENPLNIDIRSQIILNGKTLHQKHGCSKTWIPASCLPEGTQIDLSSKQILEHYGLDPSMGWAFLRAAYPWETKTKPVIKSLRLKLEQEPVSLPGIHFKTPDSGDSISFTHPITGAEHILTVQECAKQEVERQYFHGVNQELPTHYTMMTYALSPELPDQAFIIVDCEKSDKPRQKVTVPRISQASGAAAVGIIGGAHGPTAIYFTNGTKTNLHTACSALHFEPAEEVKWRMVFRVKMREDIEVEIIENEKTAR